MAKRRKGAKTSALEAAAERAARAAQPGGRRRGQREDRRQWQASILGYEMYPGELERTPRKRKVPDALTRRRELALLLAGGQRDVTQRSLATPRSRRAKARHLVDDALREAICAERDRRRQVMFARGKAGKGRRAAARRSRQLSIWSDVKC